MNFVLFLKMTQAGNAKHAYLRVPHGLTRLCNQILREYAVGKANASMRFSVLEGGTADTSGIEQLPSTFIA